MAVCKFCRNPLAYHENEQFCGQACRWAFFDRQREVAAAPADAQYTEHGLHYKIGRHGYTFRWSGEWVRTTAQLKAVRGGGYVLSAPKAVPRVTSDFAMPISALAKRT